MSDFDYRFKVILLGDCGVGKTTLTRALSKKCDFNFGKCCCYSFTPNASTDLEFRRGECRVSVKVIDTGGQERYRSLTHSYFRGADGCLILYNTNNAFSFENVISWYESLDYYSSSNMSSLTTIIVGTQIQAIKDSVVPVSRAQKMAEYLEVPCVQIDLSATENIIGVLEQMVDLMIDKYNEKESVTIDLSRRHVLNEGSGKKCMC